MHVLKWIGYFLVGITCVVVLMVIAGSFVPEEHTASVSAEVAAPQARVWKLITDVDSQPKWRTGLASVTHVEAQNGRPCWVEVQKHMRMPLCADLSTEPSTRIVRIADPNLPFGGGWTYQLEPMGGSATRVTIVEQGTTGPALWRFLGHYIFHEDANIRQFQADLQRAAKG